VRATETPMTAIWARPTALHGAHSANCMHACELTGHEVHVVTISSKAQLLVASASGGRPSCDLFRLMSSPPAALGLPQVRALPSTRKAMPPSARSSDTSTHRRDPHYPPSPPQVVTWRDAAARGGGSLSYHVVLRDQEPRGSAAAPVPPSPMLEEGVVREIDKCLSPDGAGESGWVVMDADDSQVSPHPLSPAPPPPPNLFSPPLPLPFLLGLHSILSLSDVLMPSSTHPSGFRAQRFRVQRRLPVCLGGFPVGPPLRRAGPERALPPLWPQRHRASIREAAHGESQWGLERALPPLWPQRHRASIREAAHGERPPSRGHPFKRLQIMISPPSPSRGGSLGDRRSGL
jgi:hypothetical protein